jgi:hypothetical protein
MSASSLSAARRRRAFTHRLLVDDLLRCGLCWLRRERRDWHRHRRALLGSGRGLRDVRHRCSYGSQLDGSELKRILRVRARARAAADTCAARAAARAAPAAAPARSERGAPDERIQAAHCRAHCSCSLGLLPAVCIGSRTAPELQCPTLPAHSETVPRGFGQGGRLHGPRASSSSSFSRLRRYNCSSFAAIAPHSRAAP